MSYQSRNIYLTLLKGDKPGQLMVGGIPCIQDKALDHWPIEMTAIDQTVIQSLHHISHIADGVVENDFDYIPRDPKDQRRNNICFGSLGTPNYRCIGASPQAARCNGTSQLHLRSSYSGRTIRTELTARD